MPRHELETFYKATHKACRYVMQLPTPRLIQELVQRGERCGGGASFDAILQRSLRGASRFPPQAAPFVSQMGPAHSVSALR